MLNIWFTMEEALVTLKHSLYTSVTSQNWQGASACAGATGSSDNELCTPHESQEVGQDCCFYGSATPPPLN